MANVANVEVKCATCGFNNPRFLIQCNTCNKYFCNQKLNDEKRSHAVQHMVDNKHLEFIYPFNQIGNKFPKCCICNKSNAARLALIQYEEQDQDTKQLNKVYTIVCHRDCYLDDSLQELQMYQPIHFVDTNGQFIKLLSPIPNQDIIQKQNQFNDLKPNDNTNEEAFKIYKQNEQLKINKESMQVTEDENVDEQIEKLVQQVDYLPKMPNKFNVTYADIQTVKGEPYIKHFFESDIQTGKVIFDPEQNRIYSTDLMLQKKITHKLQQNVSYQQLFSTMLALEHQHRSLEGKKQAMEINGSIPYIRRAGKQTYSELVMSWNRYDTINGDRVKPGDGLLLRIIDEDGKPLDLDCIIMRNIDFLVLKILKPIPNEDDLLQKFKDLVDVEVDGLKFTDVKDDSVLKNAAIFKGYDVWKFKVDEQKQCHIRVFLQHNEAGVVFARMKKAVSEIEDAAKDTKLYQILLGLFDGAIDKQITEYSKIVIPQANIENIMSRINTGDTGIKLNLAQEQAVRRALTYCISMIQGCPGGGKTFVASCLVNGLSLLYEKRGARGKILCCAGSNIAADNIAQFCLKMKLNALRVYAVSQEDKSLDYKKLDAIQHINLAKIVEENQRNNTYVLSHILSEKENEALGVLLLGELIFDDWIKSKNAEANTDYSEIDKEKIKAKLSDIEKREIQKADIIISTCCTSGDFRIRHIQFDAVVLDECSQSIEPEQMISVSRTNQHIVIIGDQNQLGPTMSLHELKLAGLDKSLYIRLLSMGLIPSSLNIQYRMHSGLLEFPNSQFYKGIIRPGLSDAQLQLDQRMQLPNGIMHCIKPQFPSMFLQTSGKEFYEVSSKSYSNQAESDAVCMCLRAILFEFKIFPRDIGIITPYSAQQTLLIKEVGRVHEDVEINSVDGFQGREKDVIIFSAVRANPDCQIGFLHDKRRLNVSMTRAKRLFIIIADGITLCQKQGNMWSDLWNFYYGKGAIMCGRTFAEMKPYVKEDKKEKKEEKKDEKKEEKKEK